MATNPTLLTVPLAENGSRNEIPLQAPVGTGAMSQSLGFPAETALPLGAGGVAPTREDFNGAFNLLSRLLFYTQKGWMFEWDTGQSYYKGCIVRDPEADGLLYECISDVDAGKAHPAENPENWKYFKTGGGGGGAGTSYVERDTEYVIGDVATAEGLKSWMRLECVKAGTTAVEEPDFANTDVGQLVTDGDVQWIVDDIRDGTPAGTIRGSLYLPKGYIMANGAEVQRADYPRLVHFASENNLWRGSNPGYLGLFGEGNGSETFALPDYRERWIKFAANGAGNAIVAGVPNITGYVRPVTFIASSPVIGAEAFNLSDANTPYDSTYLGTGGSNYLNKYIGFNASRCNAVYGSATTVQPPSINLFPVLKY